MGTNLYSMNLAILTPRLCLRALVLAIVDSLSAVRSILTVDGASQAAACAEHLEDGTLQLLSVGATAHGASHRVDVLPGDVAIVGDVLDLLAVPWRLLKSLDDESGSRWHHLNSDLAVHDVQLAGHVHALPLLGGLAQVLTNGLRRQLHGTHFGGQSWHRGHLTARHTDHNNLDLVGIDLSHGDLSVRLLHSPC